jgi:hypothetical protein
LKCPIPGQKIPLLLLTTGFADTWMMLIVHGRNCCCWRVVGPHYVVLCVEKCVGIGVYNRNVSLLQKLCLPFAKFIDLHFFEWYANGMLMEPGFKKWNADGTRIPEFSTFRETNMPP